MLLVTVDVGCLRTLIAQCSSVPSTGQNLQLFTCNGDVSIWVKNSRVGRKAQNNQTGAMSSSVYTWIPLILGCFVLNLVGIVPVVLQCERRRNKTAMQGNGIT